MGRPLSKSEPDDEWQYTAYDQETQWHGAKTAKVIATMGKKLQELEARKKAELSDWSKEGCIQLLQHGLSEEKGLYPPPHVLPYKSIGLVDLQRDRSLLPKEYKFYKRPCNHKEFRKKKAKSKQVEDELPTSMESVSLPLNLKSTFWNGERWCGMEFSPRTAEVANGYQLLHEELVNSQNRLKNTKMGMFFLQGLCLEETRKNSIHYPRSSQRTLTNFQSYIPLLPLANVARYQIELQIKENKRLLGLYGDEAKRTLHSYRKATAGASNDSPPIPIEKRFGGLPLKACTKLALQQLEEVLAKGTKFETLQAEYNFELLKQLAATRSTRAYTFASNYAALKGLRSPKNVVCNMESTPRRMEQFRNTLLKYPWFEVLINLIHHNSRCPNRAEMYLLDHIRFVIRTQDKFDATDYCNMICTLQLRKLDLNGLSVHRALDFVKESIHISDMDIIGDLLASKATRLPYWLETHGSLVGRAKRKLETNIFPMNTFGPTPPRPSRPAQPVIGLSRQQSLRSPLSSAKSMIKGTKTSGTKKEI